MRVVSPGGRRSPGSSKRNISKRPVSRSKNSPERPNSSARNSATGSPRPSTSRAKLRATSRSATRTPMWSKRIGGTLRGARFARRGAIGHMTTDAHTTRRLVEEIVPTGLMITGVLQDLLAELPEDAFPGESDVEVLFEMLAGTIEPATAAAGARPRARGLGARREHR